MNSKTFKKQGSSQMRKLTNRIDHKPPPGILTASLRGLVATVFSGAILLLIATTIIYSMADPTQYISSAALAVLYISAFLGGLVAGMGNRKNALVCGLLTSTFLLILIVSISLLPFPSTPHGGRLASTVLHGMAVLFTLLGAIANGRIGHKKRKFKRKK